MPWWVPHSLSHTLISIQLMPLSYVYHLFYTVTCESLRFWAPSSPGCLQSSLGVIQGHVTIYRYPWVTSMRPEQSLSFMLGRKVLSPPVPQHPTLQFNSLLLLPQEQHPCILTHEWLPATPQRHCLPSPMACSHSRPISPLSL